MRISDWSSDVCSSDLSPVISAAIVLLGIAVGIFFVRRERQQALPILPLDLLRQRDIALPCIGSLCAYIAMTITTVILPIRLQQQFGFSPVAAGAVLAPIPIVSMVVAPVSGLLSDRSEERRVGKECVSTCRYRLSPYP